MFRMLVSQTICHAISLFKNFQWLLIILKTEGKFLLFPYLFDSSCSFSGVFHFFNKSLPLSSSCTMFCSYHIRQLSIPLNDQVCPRFRITDCFSAWEFLFQMFICQCWLLPVLVGHHSDVTFQQRPLFCYPILLFNSDLSVSTS